MTPSAYHVPGRLSRAPLPQTLAECHELIRELQRYDETLLDRARTVAKRLGVTAQGAACLILLAEARGKPLSGEQLDRLLPIINRVVERDGHGVAAALIWRMRRVHGREIVLSSGAGRGRFGYWLSAEMMARVEEVLG